MDIPAEINIPSKNDRYAPIPAGTTVTVKLGQSWDKEADKFKPFGEFNSGTTKNGDPYFVVPLVVASGSFEGRKLSIFVNWNSSERNINFLADLYEKVTGKDLAEGGQINIPDMVEGFKTGLFEIEVKLQKNDPQYNDVKRLIARVGDATHDQPGDHGDVSIAVDDAPADDGDVPF